MPCNNIIKDNWYPNVYTCIVQFDPLVISFIISRISSSLKHINSTFLHQFSLVIRVL